MQTLNLFRLPPLYIYNSCHAALGSVWSTSSVQISAISCHLFTHRTTDVKKISKGVIPHSFPALRESHLVRVAAALIHCSKELPKYTEFTEKKLKINPAA